MPDPNVTPIPADIYNEAMRGTSSEPNEALRAAADRCCELVHRIEDPDLAERLKKGLEQARRGETHDLGDFSQYLDEEENEGCSWQTGGSYMSPPEHCDNDVEPGEEYCPLHREKVEAMQQWETEHGLDAL